jgi:cytochrome c553
MRARRAQGEKRVTRYLQLTAFFFAALFQFHSAQAQPVPGPPDTMEARVLACTACHGQGRQDANKIYFPRLSGKPAAYLYNQLVAFRDGRRRYPPMNYLLEFQPSAYLQAMADYFAALQPPQFTPATPIASQDLLTLGQSLVTRGAPDRGIPACSGCHGASLTGMQPAVPGLLGLPPSYISAQLGAWRYGTRTAPVPDCMQFVAGHLTETDVTAVAAWLSTLSGPANPTPVARGSLAMPLPCGSQSN